MTAPLEVMGIAEIGEALGVNPRTVSQWHRRGKLPAPDAVLKMGPVWRRSTIFIWQAKRRSDITPPPGRDGDPPSGMGWSDEFTVDKDGWGTYVGSTLVNLPGFPRFIDATTPWKPGDPCGTCGSTDTGWDDGSAFCRTCRASDNDE